VLKRVKEMLNLIRYVKKKNEKALPAKKLLEDSGVAVMKAEVKEEGMVSECDFCHKIIESFLVIPYGSWFDNSVICLKCLDGALTWLEHFIKTNEYLQDAVKSV
jgi:hypothetical protein